MAIQSYASHSYRAHAFRARSLASIPAGPQPFALVLARVTPRVFSCLFATQSAGASTASRTLSARVTHREFTPPEYPIQ